MADWKPIETAPKDGTCVLCYTEPSSREGRIHVLTWMNYAGPVGFADLDGRVKKDGGMWIVGTGLSIYFPTHWMPLPEPPTP